MILAVILLIEQVILLSNNAIISMELELHVNFILILSLVKTGVTR
jgi:hypothetical protein